MKKTVCFLFFILCGCPLLAQNGAGVKKEKLFAGGNFGFSFGHYTLINVSPQIGYRFNRFVSAGLGLNLQYVSTKEKNEYGNDYFKTSEWVTGLNLFGRFYPVERFFVQAQPEINYRFGNTTYYRTLDNLPTNQTYKNDAEIVSCFLAGGGYSAPAGKGRIIITVLYDVFQRPNSPYGNQPVVNFGYNVGL